MFENTSSYIQLSWFQYFLCRDRCRSSIQVTRVRFITSSCHPKPIRAENIQTVKYDMLIQIELVIPTLFRCIFMFHVGFALFSPAEKLRYEQHISLINASVEFRNWSIILPHFHKKIKKKGCETKIVHLENQNHKKHWDLRLDNIISWIIWYFAMKGNFETLENSRRCEIWKGFRQSGRIFQSISFQFS